MVSIHQECRNKHPCIFCSPFTIHSTDAVVEDFNQILLASMGSVMTIADARHVNAFSFGKVVSSSLSGRDEYTSFSRLCSIEVGLLDWWMRTINLAAESAQTGWVSAAHCIAWWSASLLHSWTQWPGNNYIRIFFYITRTAGAALRCRPTDATCQLALLTAWSSVCSRWWW